MTQKFRTDISDRLIRRGYIEGYYGRLLSFADRMRLLAHLREIGCNSYFYAPKEDISHRLVWRQPYDSHWIDSFGEFCSSAGDIDILAGIAPGLDYNFINPEEDYAYLRAKASQLLGAGADRLVLMFDDISDDVCALAEAGLNEGAEHGKLVSRLQDDLGCSIYLVPRLYADEIGGDIESYAHGLAHNISADVGVFICGRHIVSHTVNLQTDAGMLASYLTSHQSDQNLIIWDNLYCHDYCPRRLFLCDFIGRNPKDPLLLNGTGLVETDILYLSMMSGEDRTRLFESKGVPSSFWKIADCFNMPIFTDSPSPAPLALASSASEMIDAVDELLWRWKSPLAREWYPFLFGIKHDLQIASKLMTDNRLAKTQTPILYDLFRECKR